jgi:PAS domain S-box-containing protein
MMAWIQSRRDRTRRSLLAQARAVSSLPVVASALCVLCLVVFLLVVQRVTLQNEARMRAESIAQFVAHQSELAVLLGDTPEMEQIAQGASTIQDLLYVAIQPEHGGRVLSVKRPGETSGQISATGEIPTTLSGVITADIDILSSEEGSVMDWQALPRKQRLGTVHVGLSTARQTLAFRWIAFCALAAAIFVFTSILVVQQRRMRKVLAPLKSLMEFVRRVSEGDLSQRAEVIRRDEVGEMAAACNEMVEALSASRQQLVHALNQAQQNERRFRDLFEHAPVAYHEVDRDGIVRRVNQAECRLLGVDAEALLGSPIFDFMAPEEQPRAREDFKRRAAGQEAVTPSLREFVRSDGGRATVEIHEEFIRDQDGTVTGFRAALLDVTEEKRAERALQQVEEQLRHSQKMEAVGRLAGGVAHDFNNVLTVIIGHAGLLLSRLGEHHPIRGALEEIRKAGERASGLTRQLLAFSRRQILEPEVLNLNSALTDIGKMLRRLIGEDIELSTCLDSALGLVKVDRSQLEQVLLNLAVNARDAMPQGGTLTIETANVELDDRYARVHPEVCPGAYVMLTVSDNGQGMNAEVKGRIFEPFFTTKELGRGTGLGLATVYGIIRQHRGAISVYSEPGVGTTFKIYLPRVVETAEPFVIESPQQPAPRGTETILLVEDEEKVRSLIREVLSAEGYSVIEAQESGEAFSRSEDCSGPIHLLVTDVVLPGMNGREIARSLQARRPEMKVLYISGYTDSAVVHNGLLEGGLAFLQKPFTPVVLRNKVREVLDTPRRHAATVLLVDDDAGPRKILREALEEAGYMVLEASDGKQALELAAERGSPVHLLLTDIVMPGAMNGLEVADRLRASRPHLKVLYISGQAPSRMPMPMDSKDAALLVKPFGAKTLIRKIHELLPETDTGRPQAVESIHHA